MDRLALQDLDVTGKKVLMRVDFNVPTDFSGRIIDDIKIRAALPSIRYVIENGGSVILFSHRGRPKKADPALSLEPVSKELSKILGQPVIMASDCIGSEVRSLAKNLKPKQVLLLENLRFHPGENKPKEFPSFAKEIAGFGDLYVNDAFGSSHRAHSSTFTIAEYFPGKAAAGFLMQKELAHLGRLLSDPDRPFYAIIGGAKISSKIKVLASLLDKVDGIFIVGAMAHTFFLAKGFKIGNSLCETEYVDTARQIIKKCKKKNIFLALPLDLLVVKEVSSQAQSKIVDVENEGVPDGYQAVDIGPKSIENLSKLLKQAKSVLWNGPAGIFEVPPFEKGTKELANILADLSAFTVVGGGESAAALHSLGLTEKMTHVSTGGGATLELIEKGTLPGIEALTSLKTAKP